MSYQGVLVLRQMRRKDPKRVSPLKKISLCCTAYNHSLFLNSGLQKNSTAFPPLGDERYRTHVWAPSRREGTASRTITSPQDTETHRKPFLTSFTVGKQKLSNISGVGRGLQWDMGTEKTQILDN